MIDLEPFELKKTDLKNTLLSNRFSSIDEIQTVCNSFWSDVIMCLHDQVKYGNAAEQSLRSVLVSMTNITPSIIGLISYEKHILEYICWLFNKMAVIRKLTRYLKFSDKSITVTNIDKLMIAVESFLRSLVLYIDSLPNDTTVTSQHSTTETDSFAADMQIVVADIYSFRNLERMTNSNVETTISDVIDAFGRHGYLVLDYDGTNENQFAVMYADVPNAIMKSPSIQKYSSKEIIKQGILITPIKSRN